jgi:hypothetical protein
MRAYTLTPPNKRVNTDPQRQHVALPSWAGYARKRHLVDYPAVVSVVFAELVLWSVPEPVTGSTHEFKYRLAYVVDGVCVVRYDNEVRKGDHRNRPAKSSTAPT